MTTPWIPLYIPKTAKPKERRPFEDTRVRDRVVQTAARPIFEASFLPACLGSDPSERPTTRWRSFARK